jgi:hypothetical protein
MSSAKFAGTVGPAANPAVGFGAVAGIWPALFRRRRGARIEGTASHAGHRLGEARRCL